MPVSLGIALFITQVAPALAARGRSSTSIDLLAVVPSVVFGLWGVLVLAPQHHRLLRLALTARSTAGRCSGSIFGPARSGRSFFTAGLILAIMITPIISSLSREVIETTPADREGGALALGATRWEMIRGAVLPHSKGGLVGAVMLGLGRAMGETIAVALVIGAPPADHAQRARLRQLDARRDRQPVGRGRRRSRSRR